MRRDITHILCFKPLSFSDFSTKIAEKVQESDEFNQLLEEMTKFKPPEGLQDVGTFELKQQCLEDLDPFIAQYNRNQREEAENLYKNYMAKKTGKQAAEVVYEPKLNPISSGIFQGLAGFTRTPLFAQIINNLLRFAVGANEYLPKLPGTRVEGFLQFVLHLMLLAITEDLSNQSAHELKESESFVCMSLSKAWTKEPSHQGTTLSLLQRLLNMSEYKSCEPRVRLVLKRLRQKQPATYEREMGLMNIPVDRTDTPSPTAGSVADKELKKKLALERQAKVMAQFKAQQNSFMENQAMDWSDVSDMSDFEEDAGVTEMEEEKLWKYPAGTCILCQEETDEVRLFGTFAFISESRVLRNTDLSSEDWISEVEQTPSALDKSAEAIRPFGVAGQNRQQVAKPSSDGTIFFTERQGLGKGFPQGNCEPGPVSTGCGHIMHFSCFEVYIQATHRRHVNQIARNHPERIESKEFLCPLCKALGNAFLPIIWKGKRIMSLPALIPTWDESLATWIHQLSQIAHQPCHPPAQWSTRYMSSSLTPSLAALSAKLPETQASDPVRALLPPSRGQPMSSLGAAAAFITREESNVDVAPLSSTSSGGNSTNSIMELNQIYRRLRDTFRHNGISTEHSSLHIPMDLSPELTYTDSLVKTLAFSISVTEIGQRGVESDGSTLLDKLPQQTVTHLRILSETVSSYMAAGVLRNPHSSETAVQFISSAEAQLQTIFASAEQPWRSASLFFKPAFLSEDPFIAFVDASFFMLPSLSDSFNHSEDIGSQSLEQIVKLLPMYYIAEMIRVLLVFEFPSDVGDADPLIRTSSFLRQQFEESSEYAMTNPKDNATWTANELAALLSHVESSGLDFDLAAERIGTKDASQVCIPHSKIMFCSATDQS